MTRLRIYLDQRDWIALARIHYGLSSDPDLADALAFAQYAVDNDLASFPLSAAHYIETFHGRDPERRRRLGTFMAALSRFDTIAGAPDLLAAEVDRAVSAIAGTEPSIHPRPFGRGVAHALGLDRAYLLDEQTRSRFVRALGEDAVFNLFESASIVGPEEQLPHGNIQLPNRQAAQDQLSFEQETAGKLQKWGHTADRAHRLVLAQETTAMLDEINAAMARHGVDATILTGQQAMTDLVMSMPAKAAITRLRMRAHENSSFAWHIGDLNDMTALGTAAAYCDVVIAEKKWGDLLKRDQVHLHAAVTYNLKELPKLALVREPE